MSRRIKIAVSLFTLLAICAITLILLATAADTVVKDAVEARGSRITGARVSLARVDLLAWPGRATLDGLIVANPSGFRTDDAFRMGRVRIEYDLTSIAGPTLVIHRILIDGPQINLEAGLNGSNFEALRRNVALFGQRRRAGPGGAAPRVIVGELIIRQALVNVTASGAAMRRTGARIPELRLNGIGLAEDGVTPGDIVRRVLDSVGDAVGEIGLSAPLATPSGAPDGAAADDDVHSAPDSKGP